MIPNWNGKGAAGMGAMQKVPRGLWSPATCWGFNPWTPAACARPIGGGPLEEVPTSAGRYNPVYYAAVGLPLRLWPGWGGLVLSRLISAALSAALLAFSFLVLIRRSRYGLMLAALLACSTPMLAHLAGAVNPNGLEIAAGIAFFSAGIPLLLGPVRQNRGQLVWLMGVSGVLLAMLRSLGPIWLAAGLAALLVPQSKARLRQLWSQRLVKRWTFGLLAGVLLSGAWIVGMKTGSVVPPGGERYNYGLGQATLMYFHRWGSYLEGMVGVVGWFDIRIPAPFYWIWVCCAGSLVFFASIVGNRSDRFRFFTIFLGVFAVPGLMQISQANVVGFIIGGRYMLPLMVGMVLLAAFILERDLLNAKQAHSITKAFCLLLIPVHLVVLGYAMVRWQRGAHGDPQLSWLNPFVGDWQPPSGSVLPILLMVIGMAVMGWAFWKAPKLAAAHSAGDGMSADDVVPAQGAAPERAAEEAGRTVESAGSARLTESVC